MSRKSQRNPAITVGVSVTEISAAHGRHQDEQLRRIAVSSLRRSQWQPRSEIVFDSEFYSLVESVREQGIWNPILVREAPDGTIELIAGERRWQAAIMVGLTEISARVYPGITDVLAREIAIAENVLRTDLCPFDIASALRALRNVRSERGQDTDLRALGTASGRGKTQVGDFLLIADRLTPEVLEHARQIVGTPTITLRTLSAAALKRAAAMDAPASRAKALAKIIGGSVPSAPHRPSYEVRGSPSDTMLVKIAKPVGLLTPTEASMLRAILLPLVTALEQRAQARMD